MGLPLLLDVAWALVTEGWTAEAKDALGESIETGVSGDDLSERRARREYARAIGEVTT